MQIFSGNIPFHEIANDQRVMLEVMRGNRPSRPPAELCLSRGLDNAIWSLVEACWHQQPAQRPTARATLESIQAQSNQNPNERPEHGWNKSFMREIRSHLEGHPFFLLSEPQPDITDYYPSVYGRNGHM